MSRQIEQTAGKYAPQPSAAAAASIAAIAVPPLGVIPAAA